jgi:hypothetical protein
MRFQPEAMAMKWRWQSDLVEPNHAQLRRVVFEALQLLEAQALYRREGVCLEMRGSDQAH